jgi:hypothetical protein
MADTLGGFFHRSGEEEGPRDVFLASPIGLFTGMIASFIPGIGPLIAAGPLAGAIAGLSVGAERADSADR